MSFTYSISFSLPRNNTVEYDKSSQQLITLQSGEKLDANNACLLYSAQNRVKLFVDPLNGDIIGLEHFVGSLENLTPANCEIGECVAGCVSAIWHCGKLEKDFIYFIEFDCAVSYDSTNGFLVYGHISKDFVCVRVCNNLYLLLDCEYDLRALAIKL